LVTVLVLLRPSYSLACAEEVIFYDEVDLTMSDSQAEHMLKFLAAEFPDLGEWGAAFEASRPGGFYVDFSQYVLSQFFEPERWRLGRLSCFEVEFFQMLQHQVTLYGREPVRARFMRPFKNWVLQYSYFCTLDEFRDSIRVSILSQVDWREYPKVPSNINPDEANSSGNYARSKIFGVDGLERIPDNQIHPLRREDFRVMGRPSEGK
jgi:hypothetical protein